jgi:predicted Mrr-cat superfamily restriction endonuclease
MAATAVWGIHAGEDDEARSLFLVHRVLAVGSKTSRCDFTACTTRRDFRDELRCAYRHEELSDGQVNAYATIDYRYAREVQEGDLVAYAPKSGAPDAGAVHLGRVDGPYTCRPDKSSRYPHQRKVVWLKTMPRTDLSRAAQGALWMKPPVIWRITEGV